MTKKRRFAVALIGPDGAGKTTIGRRLEEALPMPARYLYMGVSKDSSNRMLPTTRLVHAIRRARGAEPDTGGPPDPPRLEEARPRELRRRIRKSTRAAARLANRLAEEWYRQLLASWYARRGQIVIFDRHFFSDYYAYDVAGGRRRPLSRRIHGFVLARVYPKPDLVIYLDAPAEILLERKGEGTLESLSRRRDEYLALAPVTKHFFVVDASRPVDEVTRDVARIVERFAAGGTRDDERAQSSRT
ncbi:MAG: AAA family ATPase [Thermoleophilia bacterium]|nr:AAA family ATPase [Thermoleophilia bacterium]MDQ3857380.1 AAA family ATPase [Actinomycetota bacterium]